MIDVWACLLLTGFCRIPTGLFVVRQKVFIVLWIFLKTPEAGLRITLPSDRSGSSVSGCNARLCCTGFFDFIFFVSRYNAEMVGQYRCIDSGDAQCEGFGLFQGFRWFVGQREVQRYVMIAALAAPCHVHGVGTASVVVSCYNLYGQGSDCGCVF